MTVAAYPIPTPLPETGLAYPIPTPLPETGLAYPISTPLPETGLAALTNEAGLTRLVNNT